MEPSEGSLKFYTPAAGIGTTDPWQAVSNASNETNSSNTPDPLDTEKIESYRSAIGFQMTVGHKYDHGWRRIVRRFTHSYAREVSNQE